MKKWFVGLMMLLALVLMQSTAMAATKCPTCNAYRTVKYTNDYEYLTEKMHKQIGVCPTCNTKLGGKFLNHTESLAATCTSPAYCNQCQHYYGLKNMDNHNWSEWQPNQYFPNQHYRYCLNNCGASENEPHDGNSNCVTSATCSICKATYKDTTIHAGPFTYSYEKYDESFHKRIETCTACGNKTGNQTTTKHEEEPADCISPAYCNICKSNYGSPNLENHNWSGWGYLNEKQHYRFCFRSDDHIQYADHTGGEATCMSGAICEYCNAAYGSTDPDAHVGTPTTTYAKTSEIQHTPTTTYSICKHPVTGSPEAHTQTTAATCTAAAYCGICESNYGDIDPDAHDLVQHDAQASTCAGMGWNAYEACTRCDYTTLTQLPKLVHWYGEWTPNADGTHSATCRRGCGDRRTVACAGCTCQLPTGGAITLCPVCGEVSDGTRLMLTEAAATAVTGKLPAGEVVVRMGTLENGEAVLSVAFEIGGKLTRPAGQVKITLPAELLAGYTLSLLSEDGSEAPIESVIEEDIASFTLDFTESQTPSRLLRLVPQA